MLFGYPPVRSHCYQLASPSGRDSGDPYQPAVGILALSTVRGSSFLIDGQVGKEFAPACDSTNLTSVLLASSVFWPRVDSQTSPGHCWHREPLSRFRFLERDKGGTLGMPVCLS
jgi:hypothetical protein